MSVSILAPQTCQRLHMPTDLGPTHGSVWREILHRVKPGLQCRGIDIAEPLCLDWYNQSLPNSSGARVPTQTRTGGDTLVVLVGNSKNLWPVFLEACQIDPSLLETADPLDTYIERSVQATLQSCLPGCSCRYFWSHRQSDQLTGSKHIAIQRMAHASGLAFLEQNSHLCLHPKFGPWVALRCALVFDGVQYTGVQKPPPVNRLSPSTQQYVEMAMKSAQREPSINFDDEGTKPKPCKRWLKWVAVRDALCPCHPWRYGEDQLEYHYTKNRAVLAKAVSRQ